MSYRQKTRALRRMAVIGLAIGGLAGATGYAEEPMAVSGADFGSTRPNQHRTAAPSFETAFAALPDAATNPEVQPGEVDIAAIEPATGTPLGTGTASYYGKRFHGRKTASGTAFDMNAMTAAHKTLPFGSRVRVTNPRNGRSVVVEINDRGPYAPGRVLDVSRAAAQELGMIGPGHARVELELLDS